MHPDVLFVSVINTIVILFLSVQNVTWIDTQKAEFPQDFNQDTDLDGCFMGK